MGCTGGQNQSMPPIVAKLEYPISMRLWHLFIRDARHFQILFLSSFLVYGLSSLGWGDQWERYLTLLGAGLLTQIAGIRYYGIPRHSIKSALITILGLSLLLQCQEFIWCAAAAILAIGSKFLIRYKGKHLFNPANFGIMIVILLGAPAWISPGQWGSTPMLLLFFTGAALMVLLRVGRIDTSLTFLLTLIALEVGRSVFYLGWGTDVVAHKFMNGSLLLFAFFMITDPRTTPNSRKGRIIWAMLIAVATFSLTAWHYLFTAPMWVLLAVSPLTVLLDHLFKGKQFNWFNNSEH